MTDLQRRWDDGSWERLEAERDAARADNERLYDLLSESGATEQVAALENTRDVMAAKLARLTAERDAAVAECERLRKALAGIVNSGQWQQTKPYCGRVYLNILPEDWDRAREALGVRE